MNCLCILVILAFIYIIHKSNKETFLPKYSTNNNWDIYTPDKIHNSCYGLSSKNCLKYGNCGLCNGKCIPGDKDGPFYAQSCNGTDLYNKDCWVYRDQDSKMISQADPWGYKYDNYDYIGPVNYFY